MRRINLNAGPISPESAQAIAAWRIVPESHPDYAVNEFTRACVHDCAPSKTTGLTYLSSVRLFVLWALSTGVPLERDAIFDDHQISRYRNTVLKDAPAGTRRTVRSALRSVGRRVAPKNFKYEDEPNGKNKPKVPYTNGEIAAYLRWAASLTTPTQRASALGIICLIAGGGINARERGFVFGRSVSRHPSGAVVVTIEGGTDARVVPIMEPFGEILLDLARQQPSDRNLTPVSVKRSATHEDTIVFRRYQSHGLEPICTRRLMVTWWHNAVARTDIAVLYAAAAMRKPSQIDVAVAALPEPTLDEQIAVLAAEPLFAMDITIDVRGAGQRGGARPPKKARL